jgi:hypothetical protein
VQRHTLGRQRHGEVDAGQGLADAALRPQHADHGGERALAAARGTAPPGDRLLDREPQLLGDGLRSRRQVRGQHDQVLGAGLEGMADEAVLRARAEHEHRPVGMRPGGFTQEPQRLLGLGCASEDHDVGGALAHRGPATVEPVDDARQLEPVHLAEERPDRLLVDPALEGHQGGDRVLLHQRSPFEMAPRTWERRRSTGIGGMPVTIRSRLVSVGSL